MNIKKRFAKTSSFHYSVAFAVFLFAQHSSTLAAIIPVNVVTDTLLTLDVTWNGGGLDDGQDNDSLAVPALTNWQVGPAPITLTYLGGGDGWTGILTGQHIVAPHPGEGLGAIAQFNISFDQLNPTNSASTIRLPHGGHTDVYTLSYSYVPATDTFSAELKGYHIPEPASLTLFCFGAIGMMAGQMRRRKGAVGCGEERTASIM